MIASINRKLHRFVHPELISSVVVVGLMTTGVKCVAFLKELVVARHLGTSNELDAFLVAMLIPSVMAVVIGEAFSDALLPVYARERQQNPQQARTVISNIFWICTGALVAGSFVAVLLKEPLMGLLAKGFDPAKQARSEDLLMMLVPFAVCFGAANVMRGYLQTHGRFAISAAAPVIVPVGTILLLQTAPVSPSALHLALGASLGAFCLVAILGVASSGMEKGPFLRRPAPDRLTLEVVRKAAPLIAGTAMMEGCFFIDTLMAATLPEGSVSVLTYGERICTIVLSIGGTAAGQALLPHIARLASLGDWGELTRVVRGFGGLVLLLALPCVFFFWFAAEPVVRILFERGAFDATDTAAVAGVLRFASLQIPGYILVVLGSRVIMALGANHLMVLTALFALGVNIGLNLLFMRWFGVKGIALSTAVVSAGSALILHGYGTRLLRQRRIAAALPTEATGPEREPNE